MRNALGLMLASVVAAVVIAGGWFFYSSRADHGAPQTTAARAAEPLPAPATQVVTSWRVSCAGDEAMGLGHPLVWMAISPASGFVECGYCDKRFVIDRTHVQDGH